MISFELTWNYIESAKGASKWLIFGSFEKVNNATVAYYMIIDANLHRPFIQNMIGLHANIAKDFPTF